MDKKSRTGENHVKTKKNVQSDKRSNQEKKSNITYLIGHELEMAVVIVQSFARVLFDSKNVKHYRRLKDLFVYKRPRRASLLPISVLV